jgi:hypothetical protein
LKLRTSCEKYFEISDASYIGIHSVQKRTFYVALSLILALDIALRGSELADLCTKSVRETLLVAMAVRPGDQSTQPPKAGLLLTDRQTRTGNQTAQFRQGSLGNGNGSAARVAQRAAQPAAVRGLCIGLSPSPGRSPVRKANQLSLPSGYTPEASVRRNAEAIEAH